MLRAFIIAAVLLAALPAQAANRRMVSYDSASDRARELTGAGLTFIFTQDWIRAKVETIHATAVPVAVVVNTKVDRATAAKLDALMGEERRGTSLYAIDPLAEEGRVMIRAFCPGSKTGWLAIGVIFHQDPLRVHAFGDDPKTGEPRLCASMDFTWRGEWRLPRTNRADPTQDITRPAY